MFYIKDKQKEARQAIAKHVGAYCQKYRKEILHLKVQEFSDLFNMNRISITSFENGRSNSFLYLFLYEQATIGEYNKRLFWENLFANAPNIKELMKEGDDIE